MAEWMLDEPDPLQRELEPDREDEAIREARWSAFVAWLKGDRPKSLSEFAATLWHLEQLLRRQTDPFYIAVHLQQPILDFVEREGWPAVFSALSRAMKESGL
jgi:hypothetical protein